MFIRPIEIVRGRVDIPSVELILVGECDSVNDEVDRRPVTATAANTASSRGRIVTSHGRRQSREFSGEGLNRLRNASP